MACGFLGGGWLFWVMGLLLGVDFLVGMEDVVEDEGLVSVMAVNNEIGVI